jgi:uncharacterized protein (TIGR04255 family)
MTAWPHLPHAPIAEALLDIQVVLSKSVKISDLEKLQDFTLDRFPLKKPRASGSIRIEIKGGSLEPEILKSEGPDGFFFSSSDSKQVVQARLNGFSFSRLNSYNTWETFRDEARELWGVYTKIAAPESITRLALRYINRIEIPLPMKDFKEYVRTTPEIAPGLPQGMSEFFMRLVLPKQELDAVAIITQTMEPVKEGARLPLLFDIDVFRAGSFAVATDEIWTIFESLRDLKNEIFFNSITPKAEELFK